ncbi:hypothetical protein AZF37_03565 [endosymbiont 'TC1' of Trimyema compressum]|nr:NAD(P)H-dependent oxidoreductase [endosymbiont 'TC1' of Trimyema compressum]AMP20367.1 hypothetical protein AZF37_03565 [endosymbiont 'TC1' of Trimyema compressum]
MFIKNIKPCIDCRACYKNRGCSIKNNDMHLLYEAAENADNFILASPIHFGNLTGKMLAALVDSRLIGLPNMYGKIIKKLCRSLKKGLLLITSGTKTDKKMLKIMF